MERICAFLAEFEPKRMINVERGGRGGGGGGGGGGLDGATSCVIFGVAKYQCGKADLL